MAAFDREFAAATWLDVAEAAGCSGSRSGSRMPRSTLACAESTAICSAVGSMLARVCPAVTWSPALTATLVTVPAEVKLRSERDLWRDGSSGRHRLAQRRRRGLDRRGGLSDRGRPPGQPDGRHRGHEHQGGGEDDEPSTWARTTCHWQSSVSLHGIPWSARSSVLTQRTKPGRRAEPTCEPAMRRTRHAAGVRRKESAKRLS